MTPPNLSLILIMICFWMTLWLVHRYLIIPVGRVIAERRERIDGAESAWASKNEEYLSATSRLKSEMEEAAREATGVRTSHIQGAMEKRQSRLSEARDTADQRLQKALDELEADAAAARKELQASAAELARVLAGRLLEREVTS